MIPTIAFFTPSVQDLLLIAIVALLLFGPKRIPEIARACGKAVKEFHKAKDEITDELHGKTDENQKKDEKPAATDQDADKSKK